MAWLWLVPALLLAMTCLPIAVAFEVTSRPHWQGNVRLSWAGLIRARVRLGRGAGRARAERNPRTEQPSPARRHMPARPSALLPMLGHLVGLARRLVAQTQVRRFEVNARVGLDDPADTGILYGALAPLFVSLDAGSRWSRSCVFEPEFSRECLEMSASGRLTLLPLRYLLVIGGFLMSPRTWRLVFELFEAPDNAHQ
jgi:hypothetical protein